MAKSHNLHVQKSISMFISKPFPGAQKDPDHISDLTPIKMQDNEQEWN